MRWLIDEMLPPATAIELNALGHDAVAVVSIGLGETDDTVIYNVAVREERVLVTENFADFAAILEHRIANEEPSVAVVFVRKREFPGRGALAAHLARRLHRWAADHEDPYPGPHWP